MLVCSHYPARPLLYSNSVALIITTLFNLRSKFPGVPAASTQTRDLPLAFQGDYIPSTNGRHVTISYDFKVVCDLPWCPDIQCVMPVTLYQVRRVSKFGL